MATNILPVELHSAPTVPDLEMEDLLIQADPALEDGKADHLHELIAQLRDAIEPMLLAYRQTIYLSRSIQIQSFGPHEQWVLSEHISSNYRCAFTRAAKSKVLEKAFHLFMQNMQIDEEDRFDSPAMH